MIGIKTGVIREERKLYFEKHLKLSPSPNISNVMKSWSGRSVQHAWGTGTGKCTEFWL